MTLVSSELPHAVINPIQFDQAGPVQASEKRSALIFLLSVPPISPQFATDAKVSFSVVTKPFR